MTTATYVQADQMHEKNCSIFNCINPVNAINKLGNGHKAYLIHINDFVQNGPEVQKMIDESDILIVERNLFNEVFVLVAMWVARGKCVIGIWDDSYDNIESTNPSAEFWQNGIIRYVDPNNIQQVVQMNPPPLTQMKLCLKIMKGAQVVSKKLAEDWSRYTKTYHVNNYLNMDRYKDAKPLYNFGDNIVFMWQGSLSHHYSFKSSGVIEGLERVCKRYPKVKVMLGGDKRNFDLLQNISGNQKLFQPYVPEEKFASLLSSATVGLAILNGAYDERRSWIKALEYQILKRPWIGSNLCTYAELQQYGMLVDNSADAWEYGLSKIVDNLPLYQEKANTLPYDFARSQDIDLNIEKTLALYQKIIDSPYNI